MSFFFPSEIFDKVYDITPEYLHSKGINALLLDVDNTLTGHGSQELPQEVSDWLKVMHSSNIKMTIVSNNMNKRVMPFAKRLNMSYRAFCCKPSPYGLMKATNSLGVKKSEIALIGDQVFTDVLAAKFFGIKSLMVIPMYSDYKWTIRLKRYFEKFIIQSYLKSGGKIINTRSTK